MLGRIKSIRKPNKKRTVCLIYMPWRTSHDQPLSCCAVKSRVLKIKNEEVCLHFKLITNRIPSASPDHRFQKAFTFSFINFVFAIDEIWPMWKHLVGRRLCNAICHARVLGQIASRELQAWWQARPGPKNSSAEAYHGDHETGEISFYVLYLKYVNGLIYSETLFWFCYSRSKARVMLAAWWMLILKLAGLI